MQQGGSQYGVPPPPPEMTNSFGGAATTGGGAAAAAARPSHFPIPSSDHLQQQPMAVEAVSPISSRPPQQSAASSSQQQPNYEELATTVSGSFPDDDAAGDEGERGPPGNRWPRHETLALIKIRTDMDAAFRDATLKGPLWEDVSRKLAEQGYTRSAKKCKEKFENVHKYYKRTKEGRAGRQDGKSYRFFSQLEALHNTTAATAATTRSFQHTPLPSVPPSPLPLPLPPSTTTPQLPISIQAPAPAPAPVAIAPPAELSFSTNSDTSCGSDSDEGLPSSEGQQQRKRKRGGGGGSSGSSRKTMSFFNELMRKVMEQQEAMQQRFLETIEKREQDRMIREEAWRRQEMARLAREHELMAQERTMAASRDAAVIAFLQKISAGQSLQPPQQAPLVTVAPPPPVPIVVTTTPTAVPPPPPLPPPAAQQATTPLPAQQATTPPPAQQTPPPQLPPPSQPQPQPHQQHQHQQSSPDAAVLPEQHHFGALASPVAGGSGGDLASSRWPKTEVHALINLRSGLDAKYQDAGPKGPLWEEISAGMRQMGYNRSAKRCKEKWENINKYFKKVKESNKKRPADAKTCPYFHQLDALYRQKSAAAITQNYNANSQVPSEVLPISTFPPSENAERKTSNGNGNGEAQRSNGGANKPEDTVKGAVMTMDNNNNNNHHHHRQPSATTEDYDDNEDEDLDDDEEEEDEEEQKMAYKIEYQRSNVGGAMSNGTGGNGPQAAAAATAGSFLAMVQ